MAFKAVQGNLGLLVEEFPYLTALSKQISDEFD